MPASRRILVPLVAATALALGLAPPVFAGKTLDAVKARGEVICGVNTSGPGFSATDSKGRWQGLDVDMCRAVAAAVLGSGEKVKFVPLNSQQRFASLQSGEIDILSRNTTWTLTRDASLGIVFAGINYYDGQGFMVPKKLNIDSAKKLDGATVCVQAGTTSEKNVADYFLANNMASVNHSGRSSMEVGIKVIAEDIRSQAQRHVNSCYFTMVAVGDDGQPVEVPPLQPQTETEKRRFDGAALRKQIRLQYGKRSNATQ